MPTNKNPEGHAAPEDDRAARIAARDKVRVEHEARLRQEQERRTQVAARVSELDRAGSSSPEAVQARADLGKIDASLFQLSAEIAQFRQDTESLRAELSQHPSPAAALIPAGVSSAGAVEGTAPTAPVAHSGVEEPVKLLDVLAWAESGGMDPGSLEMADVEAMAKLLQRAQRSGSQSGAASVRSGQSSVLSSRALTLHNMRVNYGSKASSVKSGSTQKSRSFVTARETPAVPTIGNSLGGCIDAFGVRHIRPEEVSEISTPRLPHASLTGHTPSAAPHMQDFGPVGHGATYAMRNQGFTAEAPLPAAAGATAFTAPRFDGGAVIDRQSISSASHSRADSMQGYPARTFHGPMQHIPGSYANVTSGVPYLPLMQASASSIKIDYKALPKFTPHEGLVPFLKYNRKWQATYQLWAQHLICNTPLQHQLLMTTLDAPQARQFLVTHMEEIIGLCMDPLAGPLLRTVAGNQTAVSAARMFSDLERVHLAAGHMDLRFSEARRPAAAATINTVQTSPSLPAHMVGAIQQTFDPQVNQPQVDEKFALIWAWMVVVEKYCCKPQPQELMVWETGMKMGESNVFDTVPPTETPAEFLQRIIDTYDAYSKFAKAQFDQSVKRGPVDIFIAGLPEELKEDGVRALKEIGVDRSTTGQQLFAVGDRVSKAHEYNTYEKGKRAVREGGDKEGTKGGDSRTKSVPTPAPNTTPEDPKQARPFSKYPWKTRAAAAALLASMGYPVTSVEDAPPPDAVSAAGQALQYPASMHPRGNGGRPGQQTGTKPDPKAGQPAAPQASTPAGAGNGRGQGNESGPPGGGKPKTCMFCQELGLQTTDHLSWQCVHKEHALQGLRAAKAEGKLKQPSRPATVAQAPAPAPAPAARSTVAPAASTLGAHPIASSGLIMGGRMSPTTGRRVKLPVTIVEDNEDDEGSMATVLSTGISFVSAASSMSVHAPSNVLYTHYSTACPSVEPSLPRVGPCGPLQEGGFLVSVGDIGEPSIVHSPSRGALCGNPATVYSPSRGALCGNPANAHFPYVGALGSTPACNAAGLLPAATSHADGLAVALQDERVGMDLQDLALKIGSSFEKLEATVQSSIQSSLQPALKVLGVEIGQLLASAVRASPTSAGAVAENYVKDPRKIFPESFVPKQPSEIPAGSTAGSKQPFPRSALKQKTPVQGQAHMPDISDCGPGNSPALEAALPHDLSEASVDSRRSSAPLAEIPKVTIPKKRKVVSFEIDKQKLEPWMQDVQDQLDFLASHETHSSSLTQAAICDLIDEYIRALSGHLSYFAPAAQVGLEFDGVKHLESNIMLDLGSNVCLTDDKWCSDHNIPVFETGLSLNTSNAVGTGLFGITPVLTISYGSPPHEVRTKHAFLVVPHRKKAPFRVLIGNSDVLRYGGSQDLGTQTLSLRTHWDTMGLKSPVVSLPLLARRP